MEGRNPSCLLRILRNRFITRETSPSSRIRNLQVVTSRGRSDITETAVKEPKGNIRGELLTSDSPGYDKGRTIWNAMIDKRPAIIVRCAGAADVIHAVDFARKHDLLVSVRGGGHNIAGNAVCDGGLVIDLSPMKSVRVSLKDKRAFVAPGATLADFDHDAQVFGLATPLGINSTTGVAGLTLGGGFGWLSRKYGMSVDNLVSVDVVTADGKLVRASASENPDLFWGIRGGGGNFGIVTSFEFQLHPVGPAVFSGLIVFPFDPAKGEKLIAPVRSFAKVLGEHVGSQPYVMWQRAFDPLLTPGFRNYWKSHNFSALTDPALDTMIEYAGKLPTPHCEIFIGLVGGQASRVASDETAYSQRDAKFVLNVHGRWETPNEDQKCTSWAKAFFKASAPYATGGVYVNFMTQEETDRIQAAYKPAVWKRLVEVKNKWDPENVFHMNQNIRPSV